MNVSTKKGLPLFAVGSPVICRETGVWWTVAEIIIGSAGDKFVPLITVVRTEHFSKAKPFVRGEHLNERVLREVMRSPDDWEVVQ